MGGRRARGQLLAAALLAAAGAPARAQESWMGDNWEAIRSKTLLDLTLPGSHNAGNTQELNADRICEPDYRYQEYLGSAAAGEASADRATFDREFLPWNVNHDHSIVQQLSIGARYFHLKLCNFNAPGSPVMPLSNVFHQHRGYTSRQSLEAHLGDMRRFLLEHPKEIIVLGFNNLLNNDSSTFDAADSMALGIAVQREFAQAGILTIIGSELARRPLWELALENRRVAIFCQGSPATLPDGVMASSELLLEGWDSAMASGDLDAAQKWLTQDMSLVGMQRGRFYVVQANPNDSEAHMYALMRSGQAPHSLYEWLQKFLMSFPWVIRQTIAAAQLIRINAISTDFLTTSKPYDLAMQLMQLPLRPAGEVKVEKTNAMCLNPAVIEGRFGDVVPSERYTLRAAYVMQRHADRWLYGHDVIGNKCWPGQKNSSGSPLMAAECESVPHVDGKLSTVWEEFAIPSDVYAAPADGSCHANGDRTQLTYQGQYHSRLWGDMLRRKYIDDPLSRSIVPRDCPAGSVAIYGDKAHKNELTLQTIYLALCERLPSKEEHPAEATLVGHAPGQEKGTPWYLSSDQCSGRMGHDLRDLHMGADTARLSSDWWTGQVQETAAEAAAAAGKSPPPSGEAAEFLDSILDCAVVHACTGLDDTPAAFLDNATGLPDTGAESLLGRMDRIVTATRLYGFKYWKSWQLTNPEVYVEFVAREYGYYFAVLSDQLRAAARGDPRAPKLTIAVMSDNHIIIRAQLAIYGLQEEAKVRPPYLSALVHEVYEEKNTSSLHVRVLYNGKAIRVCNEPESFPLCPMEEWAALVAKHVPRQPDCPALYTGYEFLAGVPGGSEVAELIGKSPAAVRGRTQLPTIPSGGIIGIVVLLSLGAVAAVLGHDHLTGGKGEGHERLMRRGARLLPAAAAAAAGPAVEAQVSEPVATYGYAAQRATAPQVLQRPSHLPGASLGQRLQPAGP